MLHYEWGSNQSAAAIFSDDGTAQDSEQNRQFFNPYATFTNTPAAAALLAPSTHFAASTHQPEVTQGNTHLSTVYDPRIYGGACFTQPSQTSLLSQLPSSQTGFTVVPKSEPFIGGNYGCTNRIGLNLGGRTYFSSSEEDIVNRFYFCRSRVADPRVGNSPRCQAEGCNADLALAKHYHRRHKVCEFHSKAATVIAAGLTQRFCQQCSRFHVLPEFDNGKRSCRRRLADHNRRRRKSQQTNHETSSNNKTHRPDKAAMSSSNGLPKTHASASVTVAISPPRTSLDCFRHRSSSHHQATTMTATACSPSTSTSSLFF